MQKKDGQIARGTMLQDREILRNAQESAIRHAQGVRRRRPTDLADDAVDVLGERGQVERFRDEAVGASAVRRIAIGHQRMAHHRNDDRVLRAAVARAFAASASV
jgi:hypothetical protein